MDIAEILSNLSGLTSAVIVIAAVGHLLLFLVLWQWQRRDWRLLADCLDQFTQELHHRSILRPASSLARQVDAFIHDVRDLLHEPTRRAERAACLQRIHVLDERRNYLDSLSFETVSNAARSMIEAYPLAGVLGTILAIGAALQGDGGEPAAMMSNVVTRFGDAIWSTFFGLCAAIVLMLVNSLLETRFERLTDTRQQIRELVAHSKRELKLMQPAVAAQSAGRTSVPASQTVDRKPENK